MTQQSTPGFIHTVFFWYADEVSDDQVTTIIKGLHSLADIPSVQSLWIGKAAGTPRDVVDNSYDMALVVHFENREAQDIYQDHQIHLDFVETCSNVWSRVQVYDILIG